MFLRQEGHTYYALMVTWRFVWLLQRAKQSQPMRTPTLHVVCLLKVRAAADTPNMFRTVSSDKQLIKGYIRCTTAAAGEAIGHDNKSELRF